MTYKATLIEGDGIGPEVTAATVAILAAAGAPIESEKAPGGQAAVDMGLAPMPEKTLQSIKANRLGLGDVLARVVGDE